MLQILEELVKLAGHLAWPAAILLIIVIMRFELKAVFRALTSRVADPETKIKLSTDGLEIGSRVDAALGRIESLETDQNQSKDLIRGVLLTDNNGQKNASPSPGATIDPDLMKLADEYLQIRAKEWRERVRLKDEAASKMANLVLTRHISKDLLAAQGHEGLIMALAAAIHSFPDKDDFARISLIADKVDRLHIKYRIVMAIGRIFERNLAASDDTNEALRILDQFTEDADPPLRRRITQTKAILELAVRSEVQKSNR